MMTPQLEKSINEKIQNLRTADPGPNADKHAAFLNAEIQLNLMAGLQDLRTTIADSTRDLIKSNEQNSKSSDGIARALVITTWVLIVATIIVAFVTIFPFIWSQLHPAI